MKKSTIQHTSKSILVLMMAATMLVSCLKENKIETTPTCAITAFNVGSIKSEVTTKKYDSMGNATDTIIIRTITGSTIFFNINQVEGHIYNIDSLPNWTDLTAVVPNFSAYGDVYAKLSDDEDLFYPIISGSSTVDFSKTVQFLCVSTDGSSQRIYNVDVYKHQSNTDTLEWKAITSDLAIRGEGKFYAVGDKVFAFAKNESDASVTTYAHHNEPATWSTPVSIPVNSASVVLFGDAFYGLDSEGYIYSAPTDQNGTVWNKVSERQVERLLAANAYYLYAYDGTNIIGLSDQSEWTNQGATDLDMLPETSINAISYASRTNQQLQVSVMTGISSHNSKNSVAWYKITSKDPLVNQPWAYIQVTADNSYGLPHFDHVSMTYYKNALFAIGDTEGKYEYLYRSDDNGITWHPQTTMYPVPKELDPANGVASIVTVNDKLWIIQENGNVWEGSIQ